MMVHALNRMEQPVPVWKTGVQDGKLFMAFGVMGPPGLQRV